jgi:hypothetical protein
MGSLCGKRDDVVEDAMVYTDPRGDNVCFQDGFGPKPKKPSIPSVSLDQEAEVIEWTSSGILNPEEMRYDFIHAPHADYGAIQQYYRETQRKDQGSQTDLSALEKDEETLNYQLNPPKPYDEELVSSEFIRQTEERKAVREVAKVINPVGPYRPITLRVQQA